MDLLIQYITYIHIPRDWKKIIFMTKTTHFFPTPNYSPLFLRGFFRGKMELSFLCKYCHFWRNIDIVKFRDLRKIGYYRKKCNIWGKKMLFLQVKLIFEKLLQLIFKSINQLLKLNFNKNQLFFNCNFNYFFNYSFQSLVNFEQLLSFLGNYCHFWTTTVIFEQLLSFLSNYCHFWAIIVIFEQILSFLRKNCHFWANIVLFEEYCHFWASIVIFEQILSFLSKYYHFWVKICHLRQNLSYLRQNLLLLSQNCHFFAAKCCVRNKAYFISIFSFGLFQSPGVRGHYWPKYLPLFSFNLSII